MAQSDFISAVNQIAAERNIDPDSVLEAIKSAIITGFRQDYPEEEGALIEVEIDPMVGSISVYADKKVVKEVTSPVTQIDLKEAKLLEKNLRENDHVLVDITPTGDFGRVAAQAARQVILQKIRESEKESIMEEFKDTIGEIDYGVVQRMDGDSVLMEIRRATAVMPVEDRIPTEFYKSGNRMKILLKEIRMTPRGKQLIVSRAAPDFLVALFKLEVPEIISGSVEIKSIAREAGSRSKIAVFSTVEGVDPIGSCVGQRGVRINAIMNELKFGNHEEKIDIISWAESENDFVANALSPAQVKKVKVTDLQNKQITVIVPDDQLSLAIGKEGQNVRLAAKLTGWNIDIQGETIKVESKDKLAVKKEVTEENEAVVEVVKEKVEKKTKKASTKKTTTKKEKKPAKATKTKVKKEMKVTKTKAAPKKAVKTVKKVATVKKPAAKKTTKKVKKEAVKTKKTK
ncbi:MAG: transcription termination factor NusA [bacterium]